MTDSFSTPPQVDLRTLQGGPQVPLGDFQEQWRSIERYYGLRVRRFLAQRAFDADELNDLVQKTWARAFTSRRQYSGTGSFEFWLMQIARTIYLNHVDAEAALRRKHAAAADGLVADGPDLEQLIHRALESEQILASVNSLDRRCLELYAQGVPHREIARRLNLGTEKAAKMKLSRLCSKLRQQFS